MTWWAFGCQIAWRLTMVASRIVTLVLFASVYKSWILLVIGLHWIAMTVWIVYQKPTFCNKRSDSRILRLMFPVVIGFIYVFCFFNVKAGFTRTRLVFFYVLMLVENCALMGAWLPYRHEYGVVFVAAVVMVFGGYLIGILALLLYYQCYHPSLKNQGVCIRTSHDVPLIEGIVYRMLCCNTCCLVRSYEDEEFSPPSGSQLHIDIPASRGSLRRDVAQGERTSSQSPRFESEFLVHKPSELQKQYSLDKEKIKREKAERVRRRHGMENAVGKGANKSVVVQLDDSVPVQNGTLSHPSSLPKDFEEIQLRNIERRNENGLAYPVDVHKPNDTRLSNGTLSEPSSPSRNFELNQRTNCENRNENGMVHSAGIHKPSIVYIGNDHEVAQGVLDNSYTNVNMEPEAAHDLNHNTSTVVQNDRQGIGSNVIIGDTGGREVHRVTDDEKETRTCDDGVHCGADDEKETRTCDDGVHCGTDDEKETRTCDDGVHCGTDDEKETRTCNDGVHCGTDDEKETRTCNDGVHCGTDDEKETKTSCDDGIHCGTDDEEEIKSTKTTKATIKSAQYSTNKKDNSDPNSSQTHNVLHSKIDHVNDACTVADSHVKSDVDVTPLPKYSNSVSFRHRYSIVSDCISLSSSTSSDDEKNEELQEKPNLNDKSFAHEGVSSTVADQTVDNNSIASEKLLGQLKSASNSSEYTRNTGSLPRSKPNPKQRTINRRSNRVNFPNFVATNLRRSRFSSLRRSREDCTMPVEDTRRHTVDFSVLTSRKPYADARLSKTLRPKKFGSARDDLEKLSLD